MGRGLAAILAAAPQNEQEDLRQVPLELIAANPHQPRRQLDEESLVALAESIKARGVIQPVLVRPVSGGRYELIAGERRWRAAQIAELDTIPAVVRRHDDAASLELAVIENMAREDLNPVDEARACAGLVEELGLTREEVGLRVGRSRVAVSNLIRLLDLPDEALGLLERRDLSEGHGRALLLTSDNAMRRNLARQAVTHGWSVRELESRARTASDAPTTESTNTSTPNANVDHPDRQAAIDQITDALGTALGADIKVRGAARGYTAQLSFSSLEEALELAQRLSA
jgi:ParB family chromosome partitioning protein